MKKKLLIVLLPVVLMITGAFAVWANEQSVVQPGCSKCVKMEKAAPCANCPNATKIEQGCGNCAKMKGATAPAGTAGCDKCAKLQQSALQPVVLVDQPVQKGGCCNKAQAQ